VNVVTGLIKSNMPCRISFRVASRQESRIVLDQNGAEVLMGQGDMLLLTPEESNLVRAQGTYVDDSEIRAITDELRRRAKPRYNPELIAINSKPVGAVDTQEKDEMFDQAVEVVLTAQRGSVSLLQRRLQIGYGRASRIIDQMAEEGILGDYKGSQARECLITLEDWQAMQQDAARTAGSSASAASQ
jgi:S-DNA-T family DNA segregation ATPase FtsK/SpoIIIE